jgi:hypothetical protein
MAPSKKTFLFRCPFCESVTYALPPEYYCSSCKKSTKSYQSDPTLFYDLEPEGKLKLKALAENYKFRLIPLDQSKTLKELIPGSKITKAFFCRSKPWRVYNVLIGEINGYEAKILADFSVTIGDSVALILDLGVNVWPSFYVRPRTFIDKITGILIKTGFNLSQAPNFAHKFYLTGSNQSEVLRKFDLKLIAFLEQNPNLALEMNESGILSVFYHKGTVPEENSEEQDCVPEIKALLEIAESVLDAMGLSNSVS